jgi:long-chain acyl-CoA synthetase
MDERGFFTIVDRMKDLIVTGGFNTYPSEVEEVLRAHPEVQEAVVVGVPDRYRGETVKAFVVRTPGSEVTAEQLLEQCRTRLSAYKVPRAVDFRDELPHSVVGKVLRRLLLDEELRRTEQDAGPPARKSPLPPGRSS